MEIKDNSDGTTTVKDYNSSNSEDLEKLHKKVGEKVKEGMGLKECPKKLLKEPKKSEREKKNKNRD